ncbi:hypothetical protein CgunFtcFv8_006195 [Champsocephalus gunnari]|uniref:Uncharacterized protein n=1 Tax=Champsocephalus gunnari TaxID=52237 RepID=A0AAN8BZY4_CHAGU|nr:hypothetical protein CgunFtcFv8_006195 [Champsocephalus gunnari]
MAHPLIAQGCTELMAEAGSFDGHTTAGTRTGICKPPKTLDQKSENIIIAGAGICKQPKTLDQQSENIIIAGAGV